MRELRQYERMQLAAINNDVLSFLLTLTQFVIRVLLGRRYGESSSSLTIVL
jgi:hypothetical protein